MKIFIIVFIFFVNTSSVFSQTPDPVLNTIMQIDFNNYVNKPVDSFLNVIPQSYSSIKILGHVRNNAARTLYIKYPGGTRINISPRTYVYMNRFDPNRIWNLALFKMETSFFISVSHRMSYDGKEVCSD